MTQCEPYMMSKGKVHGEPVKPQSIEARFQEPVYETPNLLAIYEQIQLPCFCVCICLGFILLANILYESKYVVQTLVQFIVQLNYNGSKWSQCVLVLLCTCWFIYIYIHRYVICTYDGRNMLSYRSIYLILQCIISEVKFDVVSVKIVTLLLCTSLRDDRFSQIHLQLGRSVVTILLS